MNRAKRVINAFINCVKTGQYTLDYAIVLIEDNSKYGYLTQEDKDIFYAEFGLLEEPMEEEQTEEIEE
jgi:hypothetical protein